MLLNVWVDIEVFPISTLDIHRKLRGHFDHGEYLSVASEHEVRIETLPEHT